MEGIKKERESVKRHQENWNIGGGDQPGERIDLY
jgi:hypothetical protein